MRRYALYRVPVLVIHYYYIQLYNYIIIIELIHYNYIIIIRIIYNCIIII